MTCTAIITPVYVSSEFPSRLALFDAAVASVNALGSESAHLHIIVDDGSTDPDGIKCVIKSYGDRRIRYLQRERRHADLKTASNALNFGIDAVLNGHEQIPEYNDIDSITPLHSDDVMFDIASRATTLQGNGIGAVLSKIIVQRNNVELIHRPVGEISPDDYVREGIAPFPVASIMWKPGTLAGMKRYNREELPESQRFEGIYHPAFVNVEDVLVTKLTAIYLRNMHSRIAISDTVSMLYRHHYDGLRGYHQDPQRGKTDQDLWNLNNRLMRTMYYDLSGDYHVSPSPPLIQ